MRPIAKLLKMKAKLSEIITQFVPTPTKAEVLRDYHHALGNAYATEHVGHLWTLCKGGLVI